jgi:hypothetical protein
LLSSSCTELSDHGPATENQKPEPLALHQLGRGWLSRIRARAQQMMRIGRRCLHLRYMDLTVLLFFHPICYLLFIYALSAASRRLERERERRQFCPFISFSSNFCSSGKN